MAVTAFTCVSRCALADGRAFGSVGPYEQIDGTAQFAVDPTSSFNQSITDIHLAPRDDNGLVRFTADVRILSPVDARRGNHRLLLDVPNRGNRLGLTMFNHAPRATNPLAPLDPGNGFLMGQGYTIVWCGWQHDVPSADGLMRAHVPEAHDADGPISGQMLVKFQPNAPSQVQLLSDRLHHPYPAAHLQDPAATLLVRDHDDAPPEVITRDQWSFARTDNGQVVPDASHIYLASGFVPGKLYQVIYTTAGAPVIGLGLLTTRDIVSFLRYDEAGSEHPCAGDIQYAYAFGASQSGRYLRQFLYLGLNEDEQQRSVFDGLLVHIAGGKRGGDFNQRFGQPSSTQKPSMSDRFPFTDTTQTDPETGHTDGLLERLAAKQKLPKIFLTNSSTEYWRGDASLIHTDIEGSHDVPPSCSVRIYHFAGTQHASGILPLTDTNPRDGSRGQHVFNCVDYTPLLRAALVRLDRWVTAQEEPAPSRYPSFADGTAVLPEQTAAVFTALPGVRFPDHLPRVVRFDFGPEAEAGVITVLPPKAGIAYPHFVPAVDEDGNERSGIRLPDISVPLATYTGWNGRHPEIGAPDQLIGLMGATLPFAPTQPEREALGDPRLSIEERYPSKTTYLERVTMAAQELVTAGYLLEEDVETVVEQASYRYDLLATRSIDLSRLGAGIPTSR